MDSATSARDEIVHRGEELYECDLRARLESKYHGQFLVLDVDSGEFEVDPSEIAALQRSIARRPDAPRYIKRIGFHAAHRLGGRFHAGKP
jgi:hypothetical protein